MPTIPFPGSKGRLAKQIVSLLPKRGRTYCEPFCGRGNLFWAAATAGLKYEKWWLNDISTIPFFRAVQRAGHTINVPDSSREEYERQREAYKSGDLTAELLQPFLTFNGGGYFEAGCKGREHATRNKHGRGVSGAGYERTIRECHQIMRKTRPRLTSFDWRKMGLEDLGPQDTAVFDPPYPGCNVGSYTDASLNYEELVDALLNAEFRWVLCGYLHPVLHRLGRPIWTRDVQLITVPPDDKDSRTECLWSNFSPDKNKSRYLLPPSLNAKLRTLADAASLPFSALDARIDEGLQAVANDWNSVVPYLLEMHRRLSAPGRRSDLRKGAPAGLTWTAWVESKRSKLGRSLRSVQRLLRGKTEASKNWKARPHDSLSSGSENILPSAMGVAFQMARLILEMRSRSRNTTSNKRRLERLASQFLAVAERRTQQRSGSIPAERIGIANRTSSGVTLTM